MIETSETLLSRLQKVDAHDAWKLFYEQYWAVILSYARKLGLNGHQARDVLQETMVALIRILPGFRYDRKKGRFRNFLLTIVHRKSLAALRRARRERETTVPWNAKEEGPDEMSLPDFSAAAAEEAMHLWRESVLETVMSNLARDERVGRRTIAVFRAYVIEGQPAAAVAAEFGLKENAVYQIKIRLLRRVQLEVARQLRDSGAGPA